MSWIKLDPILPSVRGCLNCGRLIQELPMNMEISVGFGDAVVTKDGKSVYSEPRDFEHRRIWTVQDAENEALKDEDHDWRIILFQPLRGRIFQRHGKGRWILVEENKGFA